MSNVTAGQELRGATPDKIAQVLQELERIEKTHEDWVVPGGAITMAPDGRLVADLGGAFGQVLLGMRTVAHEQVGEKLQIPRAYYQRMLGEASPLLADNVNYWFRDDGHKAKGYLLRCLDGHVRAVLSDQYRTLDSHALFFACSKVLRKKRAALLSLELSEERMYLRAAAPDFAQKIEGRFRELRERHGRRGHNIDMPRRNERGRWDMPKGGSAWVIPAVTVSNSEVGRGGLAVRASYLNPICDNWATLEAEIHQVHLGGRREGGLQVSAETQTLKDQALWSEVQDLVNAVFTPKKFREMMQAINEAAATEVVEPAKALDVAAEHYEMTDEEKQEAINWMMKPPHASEQGTVWGLVNAVTAVARNKPVERCAALEQAGGDLLKNAREMVEVRVR